MHRILFSILIFGALVACGIAPETLSPITPTMRAGSITPQTLGEPDSSSATSTPERIATSPGARPSATATERPSTSTPPPALNAAGPYLVYEKRDLSGPAIVVMDRQGGGRNTFPLPADAYVPDLDQALSPDGRFLAYFTGMAGGPTASVNDLSLHLLRLSDGSSQTIAALLGSNYPDNLLQIAEGIVQDDLALEEIEQTALRLLRLFIAGITALDWAPDGSALAFSGQMERLSSDLYLYNIESESIQRLTGGLEQVQWIEWSPDGELIFQSSTNEQGPGNPQTYYSLSPQGDLLRTIFSSQVGGTGLGWVNETEFAFYSTLDSPSPNRLTHVDVISGARTTIWEGPFRAFAFDPSQGVRLFSVLAAQGDDLETGLYRRIAGREADRIADFAPEQVDYVGMRNARFLIQSTHEGTLQSIDQAGELKLLRQRIGWTPIVAPNRNILALIHPLETGILLYDREGEWIEISFEHPVDLLVWRADSQAFFFVSRGELFFHHFDEDSTQRVDVGLLSGETRSPYGLKTFRLVWIPTR